MTTDLLTAADRDRILERYQTRYVAHGPTVAALASGTEAKQALRHQILRDIGMQPGDSVLDIGCGLGDFLRHATDVGLECRYTGLDLIPEFIQQCQTTFGSWGGRYAFAEADLFADHCAAIRAQGPHDWVIASQVFNNRYTDADNWTLVQAALTAMFDRCTRGVAFDCLTTRVDFEAPQLYYFDPAALLTFGLSLTRHAVLRHDYPLYEQTLYLYRAPL